MTMGKYNVAVHVYSGEDVYGRQDLVVESFSQ